MSTLFATAALLAVVAIACSALCLAWSIPSWRVWLASRNGLPRLTGARAIELRGWAALVGSGLISAGIAACAVAAWFGCYAVLSSLAVAAG